MICSNQGEFGFVKTKSLNYLNFISWIFNGNLTFPCMFPVIVRGEGI